MGVMAPSPFAVGATTTDLDFPKPKSKLPLVIGALVAVGVIVGIVVMTSSGPKPGPVATPAAPPPAPTTAPSPTAEATAAPADTATAAPTPATGAGRDPLAPPEAPASGKSSSGFSDLFAAGMEKAEKSGSTPAPGQPFDAEEARRAVAATLRTVAACKEPGSPLGQTTAAITFDSSGKVSSVTIGAPFAGTSTGTCMVTAFKQVKVTPFAGLPGTVSQAVSLR
jgi:hypothetical protein